MSIHPQSGVRGLQRLSCWSRITLGLNAAKIIDYIEKRFRQKLFRIKFSTKNSLIFQGVELGGSEDWHFVNIYNVQHSRDTMKNKLCDIQTDGKKREDFVFHCTFWWLRVCWGFIYEWKVKREYILIHY